MQLFTIWECPARGSNGKVIWFEGQANFLIPSSENYKNRWDIHTFGSGYRWKRARLLYVHVQPVIIAVYPVVQFVHKNRGVKLNWEPLIRTESPFFPATLS